MAERSTIEVFFKALGHPELQAALRSVATDADRMGDQFARATQKMSFKQDVRSSFQRAIKDQQYLAREMRRLEGLGAKGLLSEKDFADLAQMKDEYRQLGDRMRKVKQLGKGLLSDDERRDVVRLHREWNRLGDQIREVKNIQADPRIALTDGLRQQFRRAVKDQQYLAREIQKISKQAATSPLGKNEIAYLEKLKAEYRELGAVVDSIGRRGKGLLDPDELKDVTRLRRSVQGLGEEIEDIGRKKVRIDFTPLRNDLRSLRRDLAFIGGLGVAGFSKSLRGAYSATGAFLRNVGGLAPAFRLAQGAAGGLRTTVYSVSAIALTTTASVYGLKAAFDFLNEANQSITATTLALRALNGEIDKAKGQPLFRADPNGPGLIDINSGNARQTADDLRFVNKVAYDHGVAVSSLSKNYMQLKVATEGANIATADMRRTFDGLADANQVLGASQEETDRALVALRQIASKGGAVQSEDFKGQLAENFTAAYDVAAEAYGIKVDEFIKLLQSGQIRSDEFFVRFGHQLQKEYGEAAESMAGTTRVAAGRLANAWNDAKVVIASGGLDKVFGRVLTAATKLLNTLNENGAFARFGERIATSLDRVVDRFEKAVDGGYDFERVLDGIARGFDFMVRLGEGLFDLFVRLRVGAGMALDIIRGYGVEIPRVDEMLRSLGDGVVKFFTVLTTGQFSDNSFVNFLAAAFAAGAEFLKMLFSAASPGGAVTSFSAGLQAAAHWLGQLAFAFQSIRTGELSDRLDATGLGMVENIQTAIDRMGKLKTGVSEFLGVLTDSDYAPQGGNSDANGYAYALRELFTGGEAQAFDGENLRYDGQLEVLFQVRDTLKSIIDFLVENRDALASFFSGALAGISIFLSVLEGISSVLRAIGINGDLAYVAGVLFGLSKIPGLAAGVVLAFKGIAAAIGGVTVAAGLWIAAIAAVGLAVWGLYTYWDEVSTIVKVVGLRIQAAKSGDWSLFDEANNEKFLLSMRQKIRKTDEYRYLTENEGYSDSDAYDAIFKRGFELNADQMSQLDGTMRNTIASQRELAAQMQAANDNANFPSDAAANDRGPGSTVVFDLGNGKTLKMTGPDVVANRDEYELLAERMRPGRMPAWEGAGR